MFLQETKYTNPTYICDKCGKTLHYRPKRLTLKEYDDRLGHYGVANYDLCDKHYEMFMNWVTNKKKEE
jgi:hypothetical protein